ncbi:MAG: transposase zinc-binding domain-containing protein, partial [Acidobacteriota bacterium]
MSSAYLAAENQGQCGDFVLAGPGLAVCETAPAYCPRNPEESILYGVVAEQLETFLERQHRRDRIVPRFVERELRSFLECGVRANGFLRVHCDACRQDRVVPFSCKGRGYARRTAAVAWLTPRPILWIVFFPKCPFGGGCCLSPL